ncbi:hypothetical protein ACS0TY_032872 [Phlomoides rotata]
MALLTKQGWRLIQNSESLLAKTLRAHYFPQSDFLSASVRYNSSYVWHNILHGRKTLSLGLHWIVENGQLIKIWNEPWLMGEGKVCVSSDRDDALGDSVV